MNKKQKLFSYLSLGLCLCINAVQAGTISIPNEQSDKSNTINLPPAVEQKMTSKERGISLANERLGTIGTSLQQSVEEIKSHVTFLEKLLILGSTTAAEIALFASAYQNLSPIELMLSSFAAYELADLNSGFLHFVYDNISWKNTIFPTFLKKDIILTSYHHDDPCSLNQFNYWELTRGSYIVNYIFLAASAAAISSNYPMTSHIIALTGLITAQSHYLHVAAHRKPRKNPDFIRFLQNIGLILHSKTHNKHHISPYDKDFCLISGQMNGVLNLAINTGKAAYGFLKNTKNNKE